MKKFLAIIILSLLCFKNVNSEATELHDKTSLYKMIDQKATGIKLNWGPEKKKPKYQLILPKNSPLLISDYHSIWGASGGRRTLEGSYTKHEGVDFYVKPGDPIIAANDGKVLLTMTDDCAGPVMTIRHTGSRYASYLHLGKFLVNKGDKVIRGQVIAEAGKEILSKCGGGIEHLHFQINKEGPCKTCWGSWIYMGAKGTYNPHKYWTGGKGKPECFTKGKEYPKKKLTLPVLCKI
jgi:murein DD-endopeptidase MepM/ murein hydrolase activator NlpD|tara:strand:+ start:86 stop:793 length:708 start_codon:yes stop_codon:yes gene_type:complete